MSSVCSFVPSSCRGTAWLVLIYPIFLILAMTIYLSSILEEHSESIMFELTRAMKIVKFGISED
jgi:hypothetical protein